MKHESLMFLLKKQYGRGFTHGLITGITMLGFIFIMGKINGVW